MRGLMEAAKEVLKGNTELNEQDASDTKYNKVFRAVAAHYQLDPEKIDDADEETKKKFYDTLDKCYDEGEDEVPDACPVDALKNKEE